MWPMITKKRASPDTDAMRAPSSPGSHRQSKRAKLEAYRILGRGQEYSEYHEPLRDPDASAPGRLKGYKRASSTKPIPSPSRVSSSIFPLRAQSVPPGGEKGVCAIDLTSIPPSPQRSPRKGGVEIRRAPSIPPPDNDRMDVDTGDSFAPGLLQFTNTTQLPTPRANPAFCYTVNFASPSRSATPLRSGIPSASPLSPLTPLPPSPFTERLPEMQSLLAKKANAKSLGFRNNMNMNADNPTGSMVTPPVADTTASMDMFQPTPHVSSRPSPAASTSRTASVAPGSSAASQSHRVPVTSSNSMGLMPPPITSERENNPVRAVTVAGGSDQGKDALYNNSGDTGKIPTAVPSVGLSSTPRSRPDSNVMPISRPTIVGAMKPKRGPSAPQGPKRITRSVSMKEQRVKHERAGSEDTTVSSYTIEVPVATTSNVAGPSSEVVAIPSPSTTITSKPSPQKPAGVVTSQLRPPSTAHRSASVSKIPSDPSKLKQTSLNVFIKGKLLAVPAAAGSPITFTSTSTGSSSRVIPLSSLSKLPLPASPLKRPSTSKPGNTQSFPFPLGSTGTGVGTVTSRETSGRSLTSLSHALDKLVVPPPSRPNTSMGFVTKEGPSEESTPENCSRKRKAKDDASLPLASTAQGPGTTFARPTASSLKRAATMTGSGSTVVTRMRSQGGAVVGGLGRGRAMIGIFGKVGDRASKKTNLPVVVGSPLKGPAGVGGLDRDGWGVGKHKSRLSLGGAKDAGGVTGEEDVFVSQDVVMQDVSAELPIGRGGNAASQKPLPPTAVNVSNDIEIDLTTSPISADKGKQRAVPSSTLNPASSALHALSESLSSLPQTPTPPKPRVLGTRTGLRSSNAAAGKESPALDGSGSVAPGGNNEVHDGGGVGPSNGTVNGSGGVKKSSLKILKQCAIFVDVRTEQGDDAGSLFVDMLKGLGARIMGRLGQACTHIVYKNGHPNTLTRYRMLNDPKPVVVGIAWVVECAEKRARVDEERFKIDVDLINVAGGNNKHRRSIFPKHLIPITPGPGYDIPAHMFSEADDDDEGADGTDGSPSQDPDTSIRSREDDLPPLERARRRRSILPGGQTRLVP